MRNLINFPGMDYEDSGEGGLFVMMVVPESKSPTYENECSVDVSIYLTRPDCPVSVPRDIWEPYDYRTSGFQQAQRAHKMLKEAGEERLASWAFKTLSIDEISIPMLAAIHIGSTGASLYSDDRGEYWNATSKDLTPEGLALYATLYAAYDVEPMLLTFLDT